MAGTTEIRAPRRKGSGASYVLERQAGFLIRKAQQRAVEIFMEAMSDHDITPRQFSLLVKLSELGEASQNHLGRLVAMDAATTAGVVTRLAKRRLIALEDDAADRRRLVLRLTRSGETLVRETLERAPDVTRRILQPLSPGERKTFLRLLDKLC